MGEADLRWIHELASHPLWTAEEQHRIDLRRAVMKVFIEGRFRPCSCWLIQHLLDQDSGPPPTEPTGAPIEPGDLPSARSSAPRGNRKGKITKTTIANAVGVSTSMISQCSRGDKVLDAAAWTALLARFRGSLSPNTRPSLWQRVCFGYSFATAAAQVHTEGMSPTSSVGKQRVEVLSTQFFPLVFASWIRTNAPPPQGSALSAVWIEKRMHRLLEAERAGLRSDWIPTEQPAQRAAVLYFENEAVVTTTLRCVASVIFADWGTEPENPFGQVFDGSGGARC